MMATKPGMSKTLVYFGGLLVLSACGAGTSVAVDADDAVQIYLNAKNQMGADFDPDRPIIVLNEIAGNSDLDLEVFSSFQDPGFRAVDLKDGDLTAQVQVSNLVPSECQNSDLRDPEMDCLRDLGFRKIYSVVNSRGKQASSVRFVRFKDLTAPEITFKNDFPATMERTFSVPDFSSYVQASDNYDPTVEVSLVNLASIDVQTVGTYPLVFQAVDSSGNVRLEEKPFQVVDTIPPLVSIDSPLERYRTQGSIFLGGSCETSPGNQAVIVKGDVQQEVSATCIDGAFSAQVQLSSGEGDKNVYVTQRDQSDNQGVSDIRVFVRDETPPVLSNVLPNNGASFVTESFEVSGSCFGFDESPHFLNTDILIEGPGVLQQAQAECENQDVNGQGSFATMVQFSEGFGSKEVLIQQRDFAGNLRVVERSLNRVEAGTLVAFTAPETGQRFKNISGPNDLPFAGTCTGSNNVIVTLRRSGNLLVGPISRSCSSGSFSGFINLGSVSDGAATIRATQNDSGGQPSTAEVGVVIDNAAPDLIVGLPIAQDRFKNGAEIEVSGSCTTRDSGALEDNSPVKVSGPILNSPVELDCVGDSFAGQVSLDSTVSGDANETLTFTQQDTVVNGPNVATVQRQIVRDNTPPNIAATLPEFTNSLQISAEVHCEPLDGSFENDPVIFSGEGLHPSPQSFACSNSQINVSLSLNPGADGSRDFQMTQTDYAGNTAEPLFFSVTLDTLPPQVIVTSPQENDRFGQSLSFAGSCESSASDVTIRLEQSGQNPFEQDFDCSSGGAFGGVIDLASFVSGGATFRASQTDLAENTTTVFVPVIIDKDPPHLSIHQPVEGERFQNAALVEVEGECTHNDAGAANGPVELKLLGSSVSESVPCSSSNTYVASFSLPSGPDGDLSIEVSQEDSVGNPSVRTRQIYRDNTPPPIGLNPISPTAIAEIQISGTCETTNGNSSFANDKVLVSGDVLGAPEASCVNDQFEMNLSLSGSPGTKNLQLSQRDSAGNTSTQPFQVVWAEVPVITVSFEGTPFQASASPHAVGSFDLCKDFDVEASTDTPGVNVSLEIYRDAEFVGSDLAGVSKRQGSYSLRFKAPEAQDVELDLEVLVFNRESVEYSRALKTSTDWNSLRQNPSENFLLCESIDFDSGSVEMISQNFSGVLDGKSPDGLIRKVKNFKVQSLSGDAALFKEITSSGWIRNLVLEDFEVISESGHAASLVIENKGRLEQIWLRGNPASLSHIQAKSPDRQASGLAQRSNSGGEILRVFAEYLLVDSERGSAGGLVSDLRSSMISDSAVMDSVIRGDQKVGGVVSRMIKAPGALHPQPLVINSFSYQIELEGNQNVRSLVGFYENSASDSEIEDSFWLITDPLMGDDSLDPADVAKYGKALTELEFQNSSTFSWDFVEIWEMGEFAPQLRWLWEVE